MILLLPYASWVRKRFRSWPPQAFILGMLGLTSPALGGNMTWRIAHKAQSQVFSSLAWGRRRLRWNLCWRSPCATQEPCQASWDSSSGHCNPFAGCLALLPPTFAHTLFSCEILVLLTGFFWRNPLVLYLVFPFKPPQVWLRRPSYNNTHPEPHCLCLGCCCTNLKQSLK